MLDFVLGCATNDDCQNGTICKIDEDVARSFNHEISQIFAETPKKGLCVAKPSGPTNGTDCEKGVNCQSDDEGSGSKVLRSFSLKEGGIGKHLGCDVTKKITRYKN